MKIEIENVNHPGSHRRVDAARYEAMRRSLLLEAKKTITREKTTPLRWHRL